MQEGAFALIDCLGFKGIWRRKPAGLVLKKLVQIEKATNEAKIRLQGGANLLNFPLKPHILSLSDTVAISVPAIKVKNDEKLVDEKKAFAIEAVCAITTKILQLFIKDDPALTMRGCITYGEHSMKRNFIVGPAVDEAAEYQDIAEGAFVWLHPNASERLEKLKVWRIGLEREINEKINSPGTQEVEIGKKLLYLVQSTLSLPAVVKNYDMPIKGGHKLNCSIVNPLLMFERAEEREKVIKAYLESFNSDKLDILIKKQNTMNFLTEANNQCEKFFGEKFSFEQMEEIFSIIKPEDKVSQ